MKTKAQIAIESDPRVSSISDERGLGDGVWVYLKPGFKNHSTETGSIHESCWTKCLRVLKSETYKAPDEDDATEISPSDGNAEAYERNRRAENARNMVARYLDANPNRIDFFAEISHDERVAFVMEHAQFAAPYAAPSNPQAFDAPVLVSLPDINEAGLIVGCRNAEDARALAAFMRSAGRAVIVRAWQVASGGSGAYYEVL